MYMYYLLSFIPTAKYNTDFEPKTREENASQNQDGLQNNSQNQDGTITKLLNQNESQANLQSQEGLQNNSQNQEGLRKNSQNQDGSKTVNIKHKIKLSHISIKVIYVSNLINEYSSINYFCRIHSRLHQKDMKQK